MLVTARAEIGMECSVEQLTHAAICCMVLTTYYERSASDLVSAVGISV